MGYVAPPPPRAPGAHAAPNDAPWGGFLNCAALLLMAALPFVVLWAAR